MDLSHFSFECKLEYLSQIELELVFRFDYDKLKQQICCFVQFLNSYSNASQ